VSLDRPALMSGDNKSVFLNDTVPSSVLRKRHDTIAYHRIRKAIEARIMSYLMDVLLDIRKAVR
jgi:hypothetical protein